MARASVKLMTGSSFNGRGPRFTKAQTRIISNDADIAYFKGNSRFRVTMMSDAKPVTKKSSKKNDKDDAGNGDDEVIPWNKAMKKAELVEAAESRDIAITPDDKIAAIVQLLTEWDEENGDE